MSKKKIYVVDDDISVLTLFRKILTKLGDYEVWTESDGAKALAYLKDFTPDLIVLDYNLPGSSGLDICQTLRTREDYQNIPILLCSAKRSFLHSRVAKKEGFDDFIPKPIKVKKFLKIIKKNLMVSKP